MDMRGEIVVRRTALLYPAALLFLALAAVVITGCRPERQAAPTQPTMIKKSLPQPPTQPGEGEGETAMEITSEAFAQGERLPDKYAREHQDLSPPLKWSGVPEQAVALALICDDPDAPVGTWTHWLLWGLSPDRTELPEGVEAAQTLPELDGAKQGTNDFGDIGYGGPQPPRGTTHRYFFRLYALSEPLALRPGAKASEVHAALEGKVLAKAEIMATYSR